MAVSPRVDTATLTAFKTCLALASGADLCGGPTWAFCCAAMLGMPATAGCRRDCPANWLRPASTAKPTGRPAQCFKDFSWSTLESWSRPRRVVAKAEWTQGAANSRFVVTSLDLSDHQARHLYEKLHCARGEMEHRIKECQLDLFCRSHFGANMRVN